MASHNELGIEGEKLALKKLINSGFTILEKNFRFKRDEIDIIAQKGLVIVFVEVKTRANNYLGEPEEAVSMAKQKRIVKVANHYLIENDLENEGRFDIISIILNDNVKIINHIEDAFSPNWH